MNFEIDPVICFLLVVVIVFLSVAFLAALAIKINSFSRKMTYINREISRTVGMEQRYWKREKRRLWLSLLLLYHR